ncbi:anthranilate phosphoribosyltransferase [Scrofimicrobium sp. R131]|uniref:Anthranilate phosphoribosyltransferase n=1 Tax=Scrofimicrobium appendicitidis TaxID=3079930 RepID=A0AAU7VA40_9ACTO
MNQWSELAGDLVAGAELDYQSAYRLMDQIMAGELGEIRLASLLSLLAMRGPATDELHGLADAMRDNARRIGLPRAAVDIVGTGGDQAHTVNISTMAAIVVAAAGYPVVKHGNRASTSASGSADVLEALGVNLQLDPEQIVDVFDRVGIAFLFANNFHPSMRYAAATRRELGFPTVFNVLGPLTNPARPQASAIGVAKETIAPLVAGVFARRGTSAWVFRGAVRGLDEITTTEPVQVWRTVGNQVQEEVFDPAAEFGLPRAGLSDLRGGSPEHNAKVAREILAGESSPAADAVALNAAAGIVAARGIDSPLTGNAVEQLGSALSQAQEVLSSGAALNLLDRWVAASRG